MKDLLLYQTQIRSFQQRLVLTKNIRGKQQSAENTQSSKTCT